MIYSYGKNSKIIRGRERIMSEQAVQEGHPKGLYLLFMTELWERFSYYGMRAIFTLYMTKALLFDKAFASSIYGSFTGLVYLTPLLGGYLSDRYLGNRRSIITGGIMMAIGQFLLFFSGTFVPEVAATAAAGGVAAASATAELVTHSISDIPAISRFCFYGGLLVLIFGNGFFKPNISTMVGQLYPVGDKRIDSAFTIFYMGINIGAFFSPLVCGGLGDTGNPADFKYGFLAAAIGMVVSVFCFVFLKDRYIVSPAGEPIGMPPSYYAAAKPVTTDETKPAEGAVSSGQIMFWGGIFLALNALFMGYFKTDFVGSLIYSSMFAVPGLIISDPSLTRIEKDRIWVIFILAFFVIFFWSAFEQAGASLTYFAEEQTDRTIFGYNIPASYFQSINPVAIIFLATPFTWLWIGMGKRGMEPSSPLKMFFGLILLCVSYLVIAVGVKGVEAGVKVSWVWLFGVYIIQTLGELCLSPIGLSMVSKLAPVKFASLLMGTWFLSSAAANKLAGSLSALYPPGPGEFKQALAKGIDLAGILANKVTPTAEQVQMLTDMGLTAKYPVLLGYPITNLYEFFLIFIISSGVAGVLLLMIYRLLLNMMHQDPAPQAAS
jgi:POT family proton-dependent oligopeptide transporter